MPIQLTRGLALAAGADEANRAMRKAGRTAWDEDDYSIAAKTFNRLWPLCSHKMEPGDCRYCGQQSDVKTAPTTSKVRKRANGPR